MTEKLKPLPRHVSSFILIPLAATTGRGNPPRKLTMIISHPKMVLRVSWYLLYTRIAIEGELVIFCTKNNLHMCFHLLAHIFLKYCLAMSDKGYTTFQFLPHLILVFVHSYIVNYKASGSGRYLGVYESPWLRQIFGDNVDSCSNEPLLRDVLATFMVLEMIRKAQSFNKS